MEMQTCMENFIKLKESLDDAERNGLDVDETYEKQFMALRDMSYAYKVEGTLTSHEGEKRCNTSKNRYKDIVPYDHSRVTLTDASGEPGLDYINASFLKGINRDQVSYIAAQGPLPETVADFWKMLWEYNIKVVMMACNEYEGIPRKLRCQRYWALDANESLEIGDIVVTVTSVEKSNFKEYTIRHLRAMKGGETRDVTHLHYTAWPDRGVPKCIPSILSLIEHCRRIQPADAPNAPPIVVHCSAGCGRTGTILVLDYVANLLKMNKLPTDFSVFNIIAEMRKQRMAIVQSLDQYVFVHEAVVELFTQQLQSIQKSTPAYYNIETTAKSQPESKVPISTEYELIDLSSNTQPVAPLPPPKPLPRNSGGSQDLGSTVASSRPSLPRKPSSSSSPTVLSPDYDSSPPKSSPSMVVPPPKPASRSLPDASSSSSGSTGKFSLPSLPPLPAVIAPTAPKKPTTFQSSEYATVDEIESNFALSSLNANMDSLSQSDAAAANGYAYADPNALGKWSLQAIARGVEVSSGGGAYATVGGGDYSEIQYSTGNMASGSSEIAHSAVEFKGEKRSGISSSVSDSDDEAPPLPTKNFVPAPAAVATGPIQPTVLMQPSTMDRIKNKLQTATKKPIDLSNFASTGEPVRVFVREKDISYPNRVPPPKYGKRPCRMLNATLV